METPIEVVWWDGRDSWCMAIVNFLLDGFYHCDRNRKVQGDGAIVVVKADQVDGHVQELHRYLSRLEWTILIVTANEDGVWSAYQNGDSVDFSNYDGLEGTQQRNCRMWLQTPHKHQRAFRYLPWGWTPGCADKSLPWNDRLGTWELPEAPVKTWDWSFAGQITHSRREEFLKVARTMDKYQRILATSKGFSQGLQQDLYYKILAGTKVAPCPSGPITVDSMRVCEALQLGAVPICDNMSPIGAYPQYWERVFGPDHPLVALSNWTVLPDTLEMYLHSWESVSVEIQEWWKKYKLGLKTALMEDLHDLGAI